MQVMKPVQVVLFAGQANPTGGMPAHVLAGHLLETRIQVIAVGMDLGKVVIADETRALARRMPCRTRGQFAFFDQQTVGATVFSEVVQQADTHYAATDDNDSGVRLNDDLPVIESTAL